MADTDYPVNSPLAVKRWAPDLMKEALKKCYAMKFMGSDSNALIHVKSDLNKGAGDRLTFGIRQQLAGAGVSGDNTLEGNEEQLITYTQNLTINQLRHAVRSVGKMSEQRVPFSVRAEARDGLADWWADRWDTWFFNQITGNTAQADEKYFGFNTLVAPDSGHMVLGNIGPTVASNIVALTEASLSATTTARFHLGLIDRARERADLAVNTFRPIMVDGEKRYVAFIDPRQRTSLRQSTASTQWSDIQLAALAARDASDNPIYSGAIGIYNDTVIHVSTRIPRVVGATAGTTDVSRAVFCGAQAACLGFGQGYGKSSMDWNEELFDYKNKLGVEAGCIGGIVKTRFNGSDFAAITMSTYEVDA
jgi:N4-gp56 family major capsid protein